MIIELYRSECDENETWDGFVAVQLIDNADLILASEGCWPDDIGATIQGIIELYSLQSVEVVDKR